MEVFDCIMTRRSVKKFKDIPVEWDKIGTLIEAGKAAPSAGNIQGWKFIVITDAGKRKALAEACLQQYWMNKAPVHLVLCAYMERYKRFYGIRGDRMYCIQDLAAAAQNICLMAHDLGLASCWVGAFEEGMVKDALGIPSHVRPQVIIPLGYPDEQPPIPTKYTIENVSFVGRWGGKIAFLDAHLGYTSQYVREWVGEGKNIIKKIGDKLQKK